MMRMMILASLVLFLACGGKSEPAAGAPPEPAAPPVISTLQAQPATVTAGDAVELSWTTTGATSLRLDPGAVTVTGSTRRTVRPSSSVTYMLTATNALGSVSSTRAITVVPSPTAALQASVAQVGPGETLTLTPTFTGGTGALTPGVGTVTSGTPVTVGPLTATTTFVLTVTNSAGKSVTASVQVRRTGLPPDATITAPAWLATGASGAASVFEEPGATFTWTVTNGTLTAGQGTSTITFTAGASGSVTLGCTVANGAGSDTKQAVVPIGGTPPTGSVYGAPYAADTLYNYALGGRDNYVVSYRIKAERTGTWKSLRVYWVDGGGGYSAGTGGTTRVQVKNDDGSSSHLPGTTVLGSLDKVHGMSGGEYSGWSEVNFAAMTFPTPVPVEAGKLYHIVFTNVDPTPASNWVSLNLLANDTFGQPQVAQSQTDLGLLVHDGSGWKQDPLWPGRPFFHIPIYELAYGDGSKQGVGYTEVWIQQGTRTISGAQMVRQLVTPIQTRVVSEAYVRLRRTTTTGTLVLRLETSNGTLVEELTIPGSQALSDRHGWVGGVFSTPRTLQAGTRYHLVVKATAGTFEAFPIRDGSVVYGFSQSTTFQDGSCEYNTGSGWRDWYGWGTSGEGTHEGDLQFYFKLAP